MSKPQAQGARYRRLRSTGAYVFCHPCEADGCARDGMFGFGCSPESLGHWFCSEHRAMGEGAAV